MCDVILSNRTMPLKHELTTSLIINKLSSSLIVNKLVNIRWWLRDQPSNQITSKGRGRRGGADTEVVQVFTCIGVESITCCVETRLSHNEVNNGEQRRTENPENLDSVSWGGNLHTVNLSESQRLRCDWEKLEETWVFWAAWSKLWVSVDSQEQTQFPNWINTNAADWMEMNFLSDINEKQSQEKQVTNQIPISPCACLVSPHPVHLRVGIYTYHLFPFTWRTLGYYSHNYCVASARRRLHICQ